MLIATWNINGIKARIQNLLDWLDQAKPDVVCLQELKSLEENVPRIEIEALGYHCAIHGQKGFNGVAILSREPIEDIMVGLPGDETDEQARYIEAVIPAGNTAIRVGGLYLPNGNPLGTEKFTYKLAWFERLIAHCRGRLQLEEPFLLAGDYNVIPAPGDAYDPEAWLDDALYQPESRSALAALTNLGMTEAVAAVAPGTGNYTFWDYQGGAWQKNHGIRIDHILLSPEASDRVRDVGIEKQTRSWEKPSDHVPVWIELDVGR